MRAPAPFEESKTVNPSVDSEEVSTAVKMPDSELVCHAVRGGEEGVFPVARAISTLTMAKPVARMIVFILHGPQGLVSRREKITGFGEKPLHRESTGGNWISHSNRTSQLVSLCPPKILRKWIGGPHRQCYSGPVGLFRGKRIICILDLAMLLIANAKRASVVLLPRITVSPSTAFSWSASYPPRIFLGKWRL